MLFAPKIPAFNIWCVLVTMCFGVFLYVYPVWDHFTSWVMTFFFLRLGSFQLLHLQIFSWPLSILSFSDPTQYEYLNA